MVEATTFKDAKVADYFNTHFINMKVDVEKEGDGIMLQGKYNIGAFPTLVFIDTTETRMHTITRTNDFDFVVAQAKRVQSGRSLQSLYVEYENGNRSQEFLKECIEVINEAVVNRDVPRVAKIVESYLVTVERSQLSSQENWRLIRSFILSPDSPTFDYVWNHRDSFNQTLSKEQVDKVLTDIWIKGALSFAKNNGQNVVVDWDGFDAYVFRMQREKVENFTHIEFLGRLSLWETAEEWDNYASLFLNKLEQDIAAADDRILYQGFHNIVQYVQNKGDRAKAKELLSKIISYSQGNYSDAFKRLIEMFE